MVKINQAGAGGGGGGLQAVVDDLSPELGGDLDAAGKDILDVGLLNLDANAGDPLAPAAGNVWWNEGEHTVNVDTGIGSVLQVGQEMQVLVCNNTGVTIPNGKVLHPIGSIVVSGVSALEVELADASKSENSQGTLLFSTTEILNGEVGLTTRFGKVRGLDTSAISAGSQLWLSASVPGDFTDVRPEFPNYALSVGGTLNSDITNGEVFASMTSAIEDTFQNFWNGVFRETFDFRVTSDGAVVTGSLTPADGHPDMTMLFSDGSTMLETTPAKTIVLTAGADTNPQTNYVYIPQATKVLTISTSEWPVAEHIRVAQISLQSAATTQADGALRNQNINDAIEKIGRAHV